MITVHHRSPTLHTPNPGRGRSLLPETQAVLDAVRAFPRGANSVDISAALDRLPHNLGKTLSNLRQQGYIVNISQPGQLAHWVCKNSPLLQAAREEQLLAYRARMISAMGAADAAAACDAALSKPNGGRNHAANKSLQRLAVEDCLALAGPDGRSRPQIARATGLDEDTVQTVLQNLVAAQKADSLLVSGHRHWRLLSAVARAEAARPRVASARVCNASTKGVYTGAELRPNPGITADRFVAFSLPSLVNGVSVPPKRITAMCIGPAAPVAGGVSVNVRFAK